jgi:hypothetical protein
MNGGIRPSIVFEFPSFFILAFFFKVVDLD